MVASTVAWRDPLMVEPMVDARAASMDDCSAAQMVASTAVCSVALMVS